MHYKLIYQLFIVTSVFLPGSLFVSSRRFVKTDISLFHHCQQEEDLVIRVTLLHFLQHYYIKICFYILTYTSSFHLRALRVGKLPILETLTFVLESQTF